MSGNLFLSKSTLPSIVSTFCLTDPFGLLSPDRNPLETFPQSDPYYGVLVKTPTGRSFIEEVLLYRKLARLINIDSMFIIQ